MNNRFTGTIQGGPRLNRMLKGERTPPPWLDFAEGLAALAGGIFAMLIGAAVIAAFLE